MLAAGADDIDRLPVDITDGAATLPGGGRLGLGEMPLRGPATPGLRPEHLQIPTAGTGRTTFTAQLERVEARIVHLRLADGTPLTVGTTTTACRRPARPWRSARQDPTGTCSTPTGGAWPSRADSPRRMY